MNDETTERDENEERYVLTEWGCLYSVLTDYGIDVSKVPGRVGAHIVDDFMELMCKQGYILENNTGDDDLDDSRCGCDNSDAC